MEQISKTKKYKRRSQFQEIAHRFSQNKGAMLGLAFIVILILLAIFADVMFDYEAEVIKQNIPERLMSPCKEHILGTDKYGRDLFARIIYGTRASLPVGLVAVLIALVIGVVFGAAAGFFGGKVDNIIMRFMDIFAAVPSVLMAIALVAVMGEGILSLMVAVGIAAVPAFSRVVRAAVLSVRNQEYIESARAIGKNSWEIIMEHILPNCLSPIIVQVSLRIASSIILASGLSYLGLGVPAPTPEWGSLLSAGREFMRDHVNLTLFPGLAIMLTVIAFNLVGDGLRDAMDPRLKK